MNADDQQKYDTAQAALETAYANVGLGVMAEFVDTKARLLFGTTLEGIWRQQQALGLEQAQGPRE